MLGILLALKSSRSPLDVAQYPSSGAFEQTYPVEITKGISFSIIESGYSDAPEFLVYKGGKTFKNRRVTISSVLVRHPKGLFLFDSGLGSDFMEQFKENSTWFERLLFGFNVTKSTSSQLGSIADSVSLIILSHLHLDHAGDVESFTNAKAITTKKGYDFAISSNAPTPSFIMAQYDSPNLAWDYVSWKDQTYEGFEKSYNLFNDGTVVLVHIGGHTLGSIGIFLTTESGKRYFFTGDTTWALEGFTIPAAKHPMASHRVDGYPEELDKQIVHIHNLMLQKPELIVVPAHDYLVQQKLAYYPKFIK